MNYKESTINCTTWTRCRTVTVQNPVGETPKAYFQEEECVALPNEQIIKRDLAAVQKEFSPSSTFPILNPQTAEPTGETATHADVYALLFSLYMQTAMERDGV